MHHERKPEWVTIKELEENGIIVEVSQSDSFRSPRYNMRIGKRREGGGVVPFLPLFVQGQGKIHVVDVAKTIEKLVSEAQSYVESLAQEHENKQIDARIEREMRQVEREGKKRRSSGYKQHGKQAS